MSPARHASDDEMDAAIWCRHLVPDRSVYAFLADHRHELFPPETFADLTRQGRGHPSVPAEVVASVLVLQALEGLSDREAVGALRRVSPGRSRAGGGWTTRGSIRRCWCTGAIVSAARPGRGGMVPPPDADEDGEVRAELAMRIATVSGFVKLLTEVIDFGANADGAPVLQAMKALPRLLDGRKKQVTATDADWALVTGSWRRLVYGTAMARRRGARRGVANRRKPNVPSSPDTSPGKLIAKVRLAGPGRSRAPRDAIDQAGFFQGPSA